MRLISWNVNGIRACLQKGFLEQFDQLDADFFCLQETKLQRGQLNLNLPGYHQYWCYAEKKGYSGTAIFTKYEPLSVSYGLGVPELDTEGRLITLEYREFYLVTCYTPNAQRGLARIDHRMAWDEAFRQYIANLDAKKPVILCGDLNVAHQEIDLKNPASNRGSAGFSDEERQSFDKTLALGLTDTFRYLHPDTTGAYTWWSYMYHARENNAGWRIDYFLVSDRIRERVYNTPIFSKIMGSDHCPVGLELDIPCNGSVWPAERSRPAVAANPDFTAEKKTATKKTVSLSAKILAVVAAAGILMGAAMLGRNETPGTSTPQSDLDSWEFQVISYSYRLEALKVNNEPVGNMNVPMWPPSSDKTDAGTEITTRYFLRFVRDGEVATEEQIGDMKVISVSPAWKCDQTGEQKIVYKLNKKVSPGNLGDLAFSNGILEGWTFVCDATRDVIVELEAGGKQLSFVASHSVLNSRLLSTTTEELIEYAIHSDEVITTLRWVKQESYAVVFERLAQSDAVLLELFSRWDAWDAVHQHVQEHPDCTAGVLMEKVLQQQGVTLAEITEERAMEMDIDLLLKYVLSEKSVYDQLKAAEAENRKQLWESLGESQYPALKVLLQRAPGVSVLLKCLEREYNGGYRQEFAWIILEDCVDISYGKEQQKTLDVFSVAYNAYALRQGTDAQVKEMSTQDLIKNIWDADLYNMVTNGAVEYETLLRDGTVISAYDQWCEDFAAVRELETRSDAAAKMVGAIMYAVQYSSDNSIKTLQYFLEQPVFSAGLSRDIVTMYFNSMCASADVKNVATAELADVLVNCILPIARYQASLESADLREQYQLIRQWYPAFAELETREDCGLVLGKLCNIDTRLDAELTRRTMFLLGQEEYAAHLAAQSTDLQQAVAVFNISVEETQNMTSEELGKLVNQLGCYAGKFATKDLFYKSYYSLASYSAVAQVLLERSDAVEALQRCYRGDPNNTKYTHILNMNVYRDKMTLEQAEWLVGINWYGGSGRKMENVMNLLNFRCLREALDAVLTNDKNACAWAQETLVGLYPRLSSIMDQENTQNLLKLARGAEKEASQLVVENAALMLRLPIYKQWLSDADVEFVNQICAKILEQGSAGQ